MKNVFKTLGVATLLTLGFVACEKEEVEVQQNDESTEALNRAALPPSSDIDPIAYGPDLLVTFVNSTLPIVSPTACGGTGPQTSCGVNYTLTVHVKNIGNAPVTDYYYLELDKPTGNTANNVFMSPTGSLAAGATHVFNIGPAPFGGCTGTPFSLQDLVMTADIYNDIAETNETNNTARPYRYCGD